MATCMYCGAAIADGLKFCTNCGAALPVEAPIEATVIEADAQPGAFNPEAAQPFNQPADGQQYQPPQYGQQPGQQFQQPYQQQPQFSAPAQGAVTDSGNIGWGVLGFFFPIVGLILFLVWRTTKPNCAKVAGIGALIGFCLSLIMNMGILMR